MIRLQKKRGRDPRVIHGELQTMAIMLAEVRSSPIHGWGLFACVDLVAGQALGEYTGIPVPAPSGESLKREDFVLYRVGDDGEIVDGRDGTGPLRFLNHSIAANVDLDWETWTMRTAWAVKAGEELLFDYGEDWR